MDEFSSSSAARRRAQMEQQRKAAAKREADLKAVLAMLDIPDGRRGEGHFHLCTRHKELMKQDPTATILKSFELETRMCPYQHGVEYMHETPEL